MERIPARKAICGPGQGDTRFSSGDLQIATKLDPRAPLAHEAFWDLAQAQICASNATKDKEQKDHRADAMQTLQQIRAQELKGEWRPYFGSLDSWRSETNASARDEWLRNTLDISRGLTCSAPAEQTLPFVLREPKSVASAGCSGPAAIVNVSGVTNATGYYAHVWGADGVDDRRPVDGKRTIWLGDSASDEPRYFIARLEKRNGDALSPAQPFTIPGVPKSGKKCANWVTLTFEASDAGRKRKGSSPSQTQ